MYCTFPRDNKRTLEHPVPPPVDATPEAKQTGEHIFRLSNVYRTFCEGF